MEQTPLQIFTRAHTTPYSQTEQGIPRIHFLLSRGKQTLDYIRTRLR